MCDKDWCQHYCDRLLPGDKPGMATSCGKKATWKAPFASEMYPLSFCDEHAPRGGVGVLSAPFGPVDREEKR